MTKGNAALPVDTSDHTGCSSSVHKVKVYTCQLISICYINCFSYIQHSFNSHVYVYFFIKGKRADNVHKKHNCRNKSTNTAKKNTFWTSSRP